MHQQTNHDLLPHLHAHSAAHWVAFTEKTVALAAHWVASTEKTVALAAHWVAYAEKNLTLALLGMCGAG